MDYKINMKLFDRALRYILGIMFLTWAVAGGPLWAFIGVYPLATAAWGFCPVYYLIRINQDSED